MSIKHQISMKSQLGHHGIMENSRYDVIFNFLKLTLSYQAATFSTCIMQGTSCYTFLHFILLKLKLFFGDTD